MRICSITHHQVVNNPRLFREADALSEAGHEVRVVAVKQTSEQTKQDIILAARRPWKLQHLNIEKNILGAMGWFRTGLRRKIATKLWRKIEKGESLT